MKFIFLLVSLVLFSKYAHADVFDRLKNKNTNLLNEAIETDTSGYYYRLGGAYAPAPRPEEPNVVLSTKGGLGCSGFDFANSFRNTFSRQAVEDYLKNISSGTMASAPLLLLEYVSPTLADVVKHFNSLTNMKLGLRYMQCEDIEQAASDYMEKLRKKSEMECVKSCEADDIDSCIAQCKDQKDPFAFLKDSTGTLLSKGGQINILKDALEKLQINNETKDFALQTIPETVITGSEVRQIPPEKTPGDIIEEHRKKNFEDILALMDKYLQTKEVSFDELIKFSTPTVPMTEFQFKNIAMLDPAARKIAMNKISAELAYWQTLNDFEHASTVIQQVLHDPGIDEMHKESLREKQRFVKEQLEALKTERDFNKDYNDVMVTILEEADKERLRTLILDDGTEVVFETEREAEERGTLFLSNKK